MRHVRQYTLIGIALLLAQSCPAGSFSFTGKFLHDTDVQLFSFTLLQPTAGVGLRTWSYVGGVNTAGVTISGGGFEPYLSVFFADGSPMNPGFITQCPALGLPQDLNTGGCDISYPNPFSNPFPGGVWTAGTYIVALSLDANPSIGNLSDGFFAPVVLGVSEPGNFTCGPDYQGTGSPAPETDPFCSTLSPSSPQRNGHWALDILNVDSAREANAIPEPATAGFVLIGGIALLLRRRHLT